MQQAIYNTIRTPNNTAALNATLPSGLVRWAAARWDMVGVLALMAASTAYGVAALAHLGF